MVTFAMTVSADELADTLAGQYRTVMDVLAYLACHDGDTEGEFIKAVTQTNHGRGDYLLVEPFLRRLADALAAKAQVA